MEGNFADPTETGFENVSAIVHLTLEHGLRIAGRNSRLYGESAGRWSDALWAAWSGESCAEAWRAYCTDAAQRGLLFLDVLRRRGNEFIDNVEGGTPPMLDFAYQTVLDGASLSRPVNYSLLAVEPPAGVTIDPAKRPFMIVDPRAGHGAGISGFKPESQVGEAFAEGHAVYFVVFRPMPEPGQNLADVRDAEKAFLDEIQRRHSKAPKPVVIGNCQGGWGCMLLAASAPDKVGPLAINGAPMAYWAGKAGQNPIRYLGGLAGGIVPVLVLSDLGNGVFDGSLLVQNFETLNPANSYWKKYYNLYANVDEESERFLDFERWWGGFFMMNEEEIRWIIENLFVGNRLAHGQAVLGDERLDVRNIRSPIIVFASHGDNITPPPQALNWIADVYRDVNEIKARGQRIVYLLHDSIGHLGIFVSGRVAGREHDAITDAMRAVEALPPGLYEMELEQGAERLHIKFVPRTVDDIMGLDDGRDDEEMFAAVAKFSEAGARAYEAFARPLVRAMIGSESARHFFRTRPLRVEREILSDRNPLMTTVDPLAAAARENRRKVADGNSFRVLERLMSEHIEQGWNLFRDVRDAARETLFRGIYGSPAMRMIGADWLEQRRLASADNQLALHDVRAALADAEEGGEAEAVVRMLELLSRARGYVRRSRLERALELFATEEPFRSLTEEEHARLIHAQSLVVQFAPTQAEESLPRLLRTASERARALDLVMRIAGPAETMHPKALALYREFETTLADPPLPSVSPAEVATPVPSKRAKRSPSASRSPSTRNRR